VYPKYKMRNIDGYYLKKFFTERNEEGRTVYAISPEIKAMVSFRLCNLISEPFPLASMRNMDLVFCENVIIYFCRESTQRLIQNFYQMLDGDGYLFLGYSETLNLYKHSFFISWWESSYVYVKKEPGAEVIVRGREGKARECEPVLANKSYDEVLALLLKCCAEENFDECTSIFQKLSELPFNLDERFHVVKSESLLSVQDCLNAANECRIAINLSPQFLDAHLLLAVIYRELRMFENFLYEIKTSLYINSRSALGQYLYAQYCEMTGDSEGFAGHMTLARQLLRDSKGLLETAIYPVNRETRRSILSRIMGYKEG
jgi:hypothetical protein